MLVLGSEFCSLGSNVHFYATIVLLDYCLCGVAESSKYDTCHFFFLKVTLLDQGLFWFT